MVYTVAGAVVAAIMHILKYVITKAIYYIRHLKLTNVVLLTHPLFNKATSRIKAFSLLFSRK